MTYKLPTKLRFTPAAGDPVVYDLSLDGGFQWPTLVDLQDVLVQNEQVTATRSRYPINYGWLRDVHLQFLVVPGSQADATLAEVRRIMAQSDYVQEISTDGGTTWRVGYLTGGSRTKVDGVNVGAIYDFVFRVQDVLKDAPAGQVTGPGVMTAG